MNNLKLIIAREYLARVRNKTFVLMTFVSPVIMVGMVLLITYLTNLNNRGTTTITVHDESGLVIDNLQSSDDINYKDYSRLSLNQAMDSTEAQEFTGLIAIPSTQHTKDLKNKIQFYSNSSPGNELISKIEQKLSKIFTNRKLTEENIDIQQIKAAQTSVHLKLENYSGQHTSKMSNYVKMFFGGAVGYMLMMFIVIYGNMVMRSVIEEKTNRIIEIIVSSVKPIHLMMGKILGSSLAGITQFLIWIFFGALLLLAAGSWFDINILSVSPITTPGMDSSSPALVQETLIGIAHLPLLKLTICFLLYFIAGFFLYSAIYASIGAAVDSETDTQQFIFPVTVPLMLGFFVGFFSVIGDPGGIMPIIFSYIPLTSPIVMLMRIPFGVPWWEILISFIILIGSIIAVAWVGAKVYRIGILMYGKKPSYKEIGKWLKY